jgi:hypothetical protein
MRAAFLGQLTGFAMSPRDLGCNPRKFFCGERLSMRNHFSVRLTLGVLVLLGSAAAVRAQCPPGLPPGTTCHAGVDTHGAFFLIAVPANYSGKLVLWNHGYSLSPPAPLTAADLGPLALLLPLGFAGAASSYRPDAVGLGGYAVADGATDTENLRQQFVAIWGRPALTFVVGASEGGLITEMIAEVYGRDEDGRLNYDGALPLCGPLAGGRRNFYGAFDLRVVYQYYCRNLPRPSEPQYPLYLGLAPNNTLTPQQLALRINECTGVLQPAATRTALQKQNLANILTVVKIPESFLVTDMFLATLALAELTQVRTHGLSPVTNLGVKYDGSTDDAALNAGVFRAGANEEATEFFEHAYDPTGRLPMPTFTMHTIGDGEVVVENESEFHETVEDAHRQRRLFQVFTNANGHCEFSRSEFLAAFQALLNWVQTHQRPTKNEVVALCDHFKGLLGDSCGINTNFHPAEFDTRLRKRKVDTDDDHEGHHEGHHDRDRD